MNPEEQPESDWPAIRAHLVAEKIAERRNRAANPRLYMDGSVPGGCFENVTPLSQRQSAIVLRRFFAPLLSHNFAS